MTAQHAIRSYVVAGIAVLCAGFIAVAPVQTTAPSLPDVHVSAIDLTAADVADPVSYDYIFDTQIPNFFDTVSTTYQNLFADLGNMWDNWFDNSSGASWADWGASVNTLNQEGLDWIHHVNTVGLNFIEDMDVNADGSYDPSLCNIVFNLANTGNAWLADMNQDALNGIEAFNTGLTNLLDGMNSIWDMA